VLISKSWFVSWKTRGDCKPSNGIDGCGAQAPLDDGQKGATKSNPMNSSPRFQRNQRFQHDDFSENNDFTEIMGMNSWCAASE
jgi:hypothetical protein